MLPALSSGLKRGCSGPAVQGFPSVRQRAPDLIEGRHADADGEDVKRRGTSRGEPLTPALYREAPGTGLLAADRGRRGEAP
ncbi:hypothetical protein SAM23877_6091 [Streptomyces ambofaciens ATCC 23877]|uniref:Uncharacterized protein n=1 Tax=Streptomyces ambofaciens (strain ATCC 23877 / 3486 / DSM 40053 / JCM 4204 / NBRC 12836 / NRRL B-2516) TaxID=278992 RepID=A0A0K2B1W9_STRA7|nr:hypothetical protein SAM23877_6091 [Streptomyces ambofaciens ATCC 23877]WNA15426.1 hypothetical protein SAMYPH_95 [Streptomyces phage Samy]